MNDYAKIKQQIYQEIRVLVSEEFKNQKLKSYYIFEGFFDAYKLFHSDEKDDDYYLLLNIFDYIFSLGEKGKIYLWDELWESIVERDSYEKPNIYRNDFTKEQLEFIDEIISTNKQNEIRYGKNYLLRKNMNINNDIVIDRIRLCKFTDDLNKKYIDFFYHNLEDYEEYYLREYDSSEIYRSCQQSNRSLSFAIVDDFTSELYGVIALSLARNDALYNIEYYIFKKYRGNGYAKEALKGLLDKVINKEIYILSKTIRKGIVEEVVANIKCIEAKIQTDNLPSQKVVESCGFKLNGLIPFAAKLNDTYYDEKLYHLIIK